MDTKKNLEHMEQSNVVESAVHLSIVEIFLGAIIHTVNIPFGGNILSLNQGLFLTRALTPTNSRLYNFKSLVEISTITAIMKALSPAGKKLGPMMSISMQGILYALGILILGLRLPGQILGMILLSFWAFIQPLITYFLMYGSEIVEAFQYYNQKLESTFAIPSNSIFTVLFTVIAIKAFLAACIPIALIFIQPQSWKAYEDILKSIAKGKDSPQKQSLSTFQGIQKDLTRPAFIISILLMTSFFIFTGEDIALILWKTLRAFAVAIIIFYLARSIRVRNLMEKLAPHSKVINRIYKLSGQAARRFEQLL